MNIDLDEWHLARSEGEAWKRMRRLLAMWPTEHSSPAQQNALVEAERLVETMAYQVQRGLHRNPPLVIFGNPPMRQGQRERVGRGAVHRIVMDNLMSNEVHELRYRHLDDGKQYKHQFDAGVDMWAGFIDGPVLKQVVVLQGAYNQPLWKDFD